jgi:hypothetical protein
MNGVAGARAKAKPALNRSFTGKTDQRGYVDWPQANLVSGVRLDQFERDLRQGGGSFPSLAVAVPVNGSGDGEIYPSWLPAPLEHDLMPPSP